VGDDATYRCGANSAVAHVRLDSFANLLKEDSVISNRQLCNDVATLARNSDDMLEHRTDDDYNQYRRNDRTDRTYLKTVSPTFTNLLFEEQTSTPSSTTTYDGNSLQIGSVVTLVGRTTYPCVCEISKESDSLFTEGGRCVVAEGVKWQSLYLVLLSNNNSSNSTGSGTNTANNDDGGHLVLAEPASGSAGGTGRIITACRLSCLNVDRDDPPPSSSTDRTEQTGARRLLLTLYSPIPTPPGIFVADPQPAPPQLTGGGQRFVGSSGSGSLGRDGVRVIRSTKDIWFEDSNSAEQAFKALCSKIAKARSKRGHNIRHSLSSTYLPSC